MSKLGIWLNEKEFYCEVNEDTTCHEIIQQLVQPAVFIKQKPHSFGFKNINDCEYKLNKQTKQLFAKQTKISNVSDAAKMDKGWQTPRDIQSSLSVCYETRLDELSEWIGLVDSAIEVYDNTDVEDGLSEDEIVENQITRLGLLIKKQSVKLEELLKEQQHRCLYQAKVLRKSLITELDNDCDKVSCLDGQINELNSKLVLQKRMLGLRMNKQDGTRLPVLSDSVNLRNQSQRIIDSSKYFRKGLMCEKKYPEAADERNKDYQLDANNYSRILSYSVDKWPQTTGYRHNSNIHGTFLNGSGLVGSCVDGNIPNNEATEILTSKEILRNATFGLEDPDTSVLV